jgi:hypothetical protein
MQTSYENSSRITFDLLACIMAAILILTIQKSAFCFSTKPTPTNTNTKDSLQSGQRGRLRFSLIIFRCLCSVFY